MKTESSHIVPLLLGCILFGYAMVNSLVFYTRARRDREYSSKAMNEFAKSPRYGQTVWISGVIGAIGFAIASWRLVIELWARR